VYSTVAPSNPQWNISIAAPSRPFSKGSYMETLLEIPVARSSWTMFDPIAPAAPKIATLSFVRYLVAIGRAP